MKSSSTFVLLVFCNYGFLNKIDRTEKRELDRTAKNVFSLGKCVFLMQFDFEKKSYNINFTADSCSGPVMQGSQVYTQVQFFHQQWYLVNFGSYSLALIATVTFNFSLQVSCWRACHGTWNGSMETHGKTAEHNQVEDVLMLVQVGFEE